MQVFFFTQDDDISLMRDEEGALYQQDDVLFHFSRPELALALWILKHYMLSTQNTQTFGRIFHSMTLRQMELDAMQGHGTEGIATETLQ